MSSLKPGLETNAGLTFKLLRETGRRANMSVYYEAGIQWRDWTETFGVVAGRGINRQIERAYGVLCSRYRPGDKIFLIGYSRGAFAVRSLAGVIDRVGLVRADAATERNIRTAYRHYKTGGRSPYALRFRQMHCHETVEVNALGVWDTVKSLGLRLPLLWKLEAPRHSFHSDGLVPVVRSAFHALALDETRDAFAPEVWTRPDGWTGRLEQVWFRGTHGDVGGQIGIHSYARPLANIPLVWLLESLESEGLDLPAGWQDRFPRDPQARMVSTWVGWGKMFLARHHRRRKISSFDTIHPSAERQAAPRRKPVDLLGWLPRRHI